MEPSWTNKMWAGDEEDGNARSAGVLGSLPVSLSDCALRSQVSLAPDTCGVLLTGIPRERDKMLVLNKMKF